MTSQNFHQHFDVSGRGPPCSTIFILKLLTAGYRSDQHQTAARLALARIGRLGPQCGRSGPRRLIGGICP